jgi:hypothetical protein
MNIDNTDFKIALDSVSDKTQLKGVFSDEELSSAEEQINKKIIYLNQQLESVHILQIINENL